MRTFRRRGSALLLATALVGGALAVGGISSASGAEPLTITTTALPEALAGAPYSATLTAIGGVPPYTWAHTAGALRFLDVSPDGVISGTATNEPFMFGNTFTVTDSADPPTIVTASFFFTVHARPLRITTSSLPAGAVGQPYSAQLSADQGIAPFTFAKASALPKGMKLSKTGAISGVPLKGGDFFVAFTVTDSKSVQQIATRSFPLTITGGTTKPGGAGPKPLIAGSGDVHCVGGVRMKVAMAGTNAQYNVVGQLKGKLGCSGSTANSAVQVTTAKVVGGFRHSGTCTVSGVHENTFPSQTLFSPITINWLAKGGKLFGTTVAFSNFQAGALGWRLPAAVPTGGSTVTGSYAGLDTANATLATGAIGAIEAQCGQIKKKANIVGTLTLDL